MKSILDFLKGGRKILCVASGGETDLLGFFAIKELLDEFNINCSFASIPWGRPGVVHDFGPQRYNTKNFKGLDLGKTLLLNKNSKLPNVFLSLFSNIVSLPVYVLDIFNGVRGLNLSIKQVLKHSNSDLILLLDSGGDILGTGLESGAVSPLIEAVNLAALDDMSVEVIAVVLGIGCDGELKKSEYEEGLSSAMSKNAYLGAFGVSLKFLNKIEMIIREIPSDSSTLPFKAARGLRGEISIRKGRRKAEVSPFSTIAFFIKVNALIEHNQFAKKLIKTNSLEEIDAVFKLMGKMTELDHVRICEKIFASKKIIPGGP